MLRRLAPALFVVALACTDAVTSPVAPTRVGQATAIGDREITVTNAEDGGPGSLRAALAEASADSTVTRISVVGVNAIYVGEPLTFAGRQPLTIDGGMVGLWGLNASGDLFVAHTQSSITFTRIGFIYGPAVGLKVLVPATATGTVRVVLDQVLFAGNMGHGVLVNDQTGYLTDPNSTSSAGSAASIRVEVTNTDINDNGGTRGLTSWPPIATLPDQDGLRINEGGDGSAIVVLRGVSVSRNGDDGVEIDERGKGTLDVRLEPSSMASPMSTANIVQGNGIVSLADYGDGIRLEESDAGDLKVYVDSVDVNSNYGQAIDARENGAGSIVATVARSVIRYHGDDALVLLEDDRIAGGGNVNFSVTDSRFELNGENPYEGEREFANIFVHEKGAGSVDAQLTRTQVTPGGYWGPFPGTSGLFVREEAGGSLRATLNDVVLDGHRTVGVAFEETGSGDLVASLAGGSVSNNGVAGIQAAQGPAGRGTVTLTGVRMDGNGTGADNVQVVFGNVTVVTSP